MTTVTPVRDACHQRGITRLCHFTQARNLPHIIGEGRLLSARDLRDHDLPVNSNDTGRLDGHDDHISCSIEYPNVWFLNQAAAREPLFHDWVVLEITPDYLWKAGTLFSAVNAARGAGRHVDEGIDAFEMLFDPTPLGSRFSRSMFHLPACPSDNQAEVLVAGAILIDAITGVIFPSQDAAAMEQERLSLLDLSIGNAVWKVSPEMYDAHRLAGRIRSGERVAEEFAATSAPISRQTT